MKRIKKGAGQGGSVYMQVSMPPVKSMKVWLQPCEKCSGPLAGGLLKKITNYEFLGTLYLLKHMLPNLTALSKVFQTGSLNFAMITPSLTKCKAKLEEVAEKGQCPTR